MLTELSLHCSRASLCESNICSILSQACGPLLIEEGNVGQVPADSYLGMTGSKAEGQECHYSQCSPRTKIISLPWELVREAESQVLPRPTESESEL